MNFSTRHIASFSIAILCVASGSALAQNADTIFTGGFEVGEVTPLAGPCNDFYPADFSLAEGMDNPTPPSLAKPDKGVVFREPNFNTCVVRATIHDVEPPVTFARNDYSRREAFNADNSRLLVYASDGFWHLYDANTLQWVERLEGPAGDAEPQWDPVDPNVFYFVPINGGKSLRKMHVDTNTWETVADFSSSLPAWASSAQHIWTRSEGSPSKDGRYWAFQVEDANFGILGFMTWDLQQNQMVGSRQMTVRPNNVSMTPSGRWVVSGGDTEGTWAWSPDFSVKKKLHHKVEHVDVAVGVDGHDYYIAPDYETDHGDVFAADIDACPSVPADATDAPTCDRIVLFHLYNDGSTAALHISGKAFNKPGWVLMGTYITTPQRDGVWPWFTDKLFAIEIAPNPRVYNLAYHRVYSDGYWTEPHSSPNRDFTRLMFNTNWGNESSTDVDDYMIELPQNALPPAAQP